MVAEGRALPDGAGISSYASAKARKLVLGDIRLSVCGGANPILFFVIICHTLYNDS